MLKKCKYNTDKIICKSYFKQSSNKGEPIAHMKGASCDNHEVEGSRLQVKLRIKIFWKEKGNKDLNILDFKENCNNIYKTISKTVEGKKKTILS